MRANDALGKALRAFDAGDDDRARIAALVAMAIALNEISDQIAKAAAGIMGVLEHERRRHDPEEE